LLASVAILGMIVVPVALAGSGPGASPSGLKGKFKKLQQQVAALQQELDNLQQQPGPQGPQGEQGPPGSTAGDATTLDGFDTATTSTPSRIYASAGDGNLPDDTVDANTVDLESLTAADLGPDSVVGGPGGDVDDDSLIDNDLAPNAVGASELGPSAVVGGLDGDVQDDTINTDDVLNNSLTATDISNTLGTMFLGSDINPTEFDFTNDFINLVDGTTDSIEASEDVFVVPINVIASHLFAAVDVAPGAGKDRWTISVSDDGVDTALSCQIDELATSCTSNNATVITAGSRLTIHVNPNAEGGGAGNNVNPASSMRASFALTP
jgi:hypothetical protein